MPVTTAKYQRHKADDPLFRTPRVIFMAALVTKSLVEFARG